MRLTTPLIVLAFVACATPETADWDMYERHHDDDIREAPLGEEPIRETGRPKGVGAPPKIQMEAFCNDDTCSSVLLSAGGTDDAESYEWSIAGDVVSEGSFVIVDLADYELPRMLVDGDDPDAEPDPASLFVNVDLTVRGNGKETTYSTAMLQAPLLPPDRDDDVPGVGGTIFPTIIVGIVDCNTPVVITQIGGCLTSNDDLTHEVYETPRGGQPSTNFLTYDYPDNTVSLGHAEGAVWKLNGMTADAYAGQVNANNYGTSATDPFKAIAPAGNDHLTSYYRMQEGDRLRVKVHHAYGTDVQIGMPTWMTLECEDGAIDAGADQSAS